jgi:hypothetical protein
MNNSWNARGDTFFLPAYPIPEEPFPREERHLGVVGDRAMVTIDRDIIGNARFPMVRTDFRKSLKLYGSPKSISNGNPKEPSANPPKR